MGWLQLAMFGFYLKLVDQWLVKWIGVWKNTETSIMGISTQIDFEVIDPKEGSTSFIALFSWPWGRKLKATISLERDKIKVKGKKKGHNTLRPSQRKTPGWSWWSRCRYTSPIPNCEK